MVENMKKIGIGLALIAVLAWVAWGAIVCIIFFAAGPSSWYVWDWLCYLSVVPFYAAAIGIVVMIAWNVGDTARG